MVMVDTELTNRWSVMVRRATLTTTLLAIIVVASLPTSSPAQAATFNVNMGNFFFSPNSITIIVGDTVTWTNVGGSHSSTSGTGGSTPVPDGMWDSGVLSTSQVFSATVFNTPGTLTYYCKVHPTSMNATVTVQAPPPAAPTSLTAADRPNDEGGAIDLTWTPSATGGVTEQRLYRSTTSGSYTTPVATFNDNTTNSHTDTGLTDGTTYFYVVRAFDGANESADSNEASAAPVDNVTPQPPASLTAADTSGDQGGAIDLAWTPSTSTDVTEQRLYRSTTSGSYTTAVATFNNNTTNSHTDNGLVNGTTYYYAVRAWDGVYESANSNEDSAAPLDNLAPQSPTGLAAADTPNDGGEAIDLTWTPSTSTDVTEQRLYRGTTPGSHPTLVATTTSSTSAYTDTGVTEGNTYYYVVRAFDGTSEGGDSNEDSAEPIDDPPAAPTGIVAGDRPGDQGGAIDLSWTPSASTDVTEQRLYRATVSGGLYNQIATTTSSTNAYTDPGLTNGTTYYYVVRAFDGTNESVDSNEASAAPVDNLPPQPPPVLGAADQPSDQGGAIVLLWAPSISTDVTEQRLYRGTTPGSHPTLVATTTSSTNTYTDTGLTNGSLYYYVVRAFDDTSESGDSDEASAAPLDNLPPQPPVALTATDRPVDGGGRHRPGLDAVDLHRHHRAKAVPGHQLRVVSDPGHDHQRRFHQRLHRHRAD